MTNNTKFIIFSALFLIGVIITLLYSIFLSNVNTTNLNEEPFEVKNGESTKLIIENLNNKGFLKPNSFFYVLFKVSSFIGNKKIYAGFYKIEDKHNNWQVFKMLINKRFIEPISVTIPPGFEIRRIASVLHNKLKIDSSAFVMKAKNSDYVKQLEINATSLEGYLYPDTYEFIYKSSLDLVLKTLVNRHKEIWNEEIEEEFKKQDKSRNEILTLASIVQGETSNENEAKIVAGLYLNRIKIGMPLQADPTVQYALGKRKRLSYQDYALQSPYNTYLIKGLPPTPIGNPSVTAIKAVLHPATHNYIYMVARGDGSGLHNFAENYQQHLAFVSNYRKNINKN